VAALQVSGVRRAAPADRDAVAAMLGRCGGQTLFHRFLHPIRSTPAWYLDQVVAVGPRRVTLLAAAAGVVIGIGELHQDADDVAEVGLLVEDGWQRRGVGTRLLARLLEEAHRRHLCALSALVSSDNDHVIRMLARVGSLTAVPGPGVRDVHVSLCSVGPLAATG
jgi:N-acetylglutamate synthase-like GNAT family acetyltransferase